MMTGLMRKVQRQKFVVLIILLVLSLTGCAAESAASRSASPTPFEEKEFTATPIPPTPTKTPTPTPLPSATPSPTSSPTLTPTSTPTLTPTPTSKPTRQVYAVQPAAGSRADMQRVVIISVDGLRTDALAQSDTPVLDALIAQGAYSDSAQTVTPSATLIGHASMLGGMTPAHHGIYWNINAPELGKIKGPTLFSVAHDAGLTSAMISGKPRLEHIVLPNSVDNYVYAGYLDQMTVADALDVIETDMPDILFVHMPDVDEQGHATGWMSAEQFATISQADARIGEIIAALQTHGYWERTLLIVTADHGGEGYRHGGNTPGEIIVPWLVFGPGVQPGIRLQSEVMIYDTAATVLYALDLPIPPAWDGRPIVEVFGE
jgi:predicted AlkP superfamily pyrophosphatase or phosphodiesterase